MQCKIKTDCLSYDFTDFLRLMKGYQLFSINIMKPLVICTQCLNSPSLVFYFPIDSLVVFVYQFMTWFYAVLPFPLFQDPSSPRASPTHSPRENGIDKTRLLKKDASSSPASTASSGSSTSLKSKEMALVGGSLWSRLSSFL